MNKLSPEKVLDRAQGCFIGQFAGDAMGSLVEFYSPGKIKLEYPDGFTELIDGGTWNTIAGQPTDDSEMAIALTCSLIEAGTYNEEIARKHYLDWLNSHPFDCGITTGSGLGGTPIESSQANGALMRVSPLGVFGSRYSPEEVASWAMLDAGITHPNMVCQVANAVFAMAIADSVANATPPSELHQKMRKWAADLKADSELAKAIDEAAETPPKDFLKSQGWVLIALQNAIFRMLHEEDPQKAISQTILSGGDTDTNAAICGALLGAIHGRSAFPKQWEECLLRCRPEKGAPGVYRPRPKEYWPINVLDWPRTLIYEEITHEAQEITRIAV